MKKLFFLVLVFVLLLSLFACNDDLPTPNDGGTTGGTEDAPPANDGDGTTNGGSTTDGDKEDQNKDRVSVWDGSVATAFSSGDGTEATPYLIESAAELAFLAKSVNEGESYEKKHLRLCCDIDLNDLEWTPIGNGSNNFSGVFDGDGHSVSHLKITKGVCFESGLGGPDRILTQYAAGLFGTTLNPTIRSLTLDGVNITFQSETLLNMAYVGGAIGILKADAGCEISDIKVLNLAVTCNNEDSKGNAQLSAGGVVGMVFADSIHSSVTMSRLYTTANVSLVNSRMANNYVGGLLGYVRADNLFDLKDCASYLSVAIDKEICYSQDNKIAAIGAIGEQYNTASLGNIFSKVSIDMIHNVSHGYPSYIADVIAAQVTMRKPDSYLFENLFGYVEQIDEETKERVVDKRLYDIPYPEAYKETNCLGAEALPDNHGFDENIWNLEDLSHPKLK